MYFLRTQQESLHEAVSDVTAVTTTRFATHGQRPVVIDQKSPTAVAPKIVGCHTTTEVADAATEALVG